MEREYLRQEVLAEIRHWAQGTNVESLESIVQRFMERIELEQFEKDTEKKEN